jgi:hypothetical protein
MMNELATLYFYSTIIYNSQGSLGQVELILLSMMKDTKTDKVVT